MIVILCYRRAKLSPNALEMSVYTGRQIIGFVVVK
jgi:hypothetical protein